MNSLTKIVLTAFMAAVVSSPCYADTVTKTTTTVTTIRSDAPIYTGPVQEVELIELTLRDFKRLSGSKPIIARQYYNEYQRELKQPKPNATLVPYKMKIIDRDLVLADFQGVNVSPELAHRRHHEYLRTNPVQIDGQSVRYVYVYHTPVVQLV